MPYRKRGARARHETRPLERGKAGLRHRELGDESAVATDSPFEAEDDLGVEASREQAEFGCHDGLESEVARAVGLSSEGHCGSHENQDQTSHSEHEMVCAQPMLSFGGCRIRIHHTSAQVTEYRSLQTHPRYAK